MKANKYKKKPVVIEALQWTGENDKEMELFLGSYFMHYFYSGKKKMVILTLEGVVAATVGDYIIKGVHGEFYPCKPDIFDETYDLVEEEVE